MILISRIMMLEKSLHQYWDISELNARWSLVPAYIQFLAV